MAKLRPLLLKDHEKVIAYAFAGSEGLTSMPKDRQILERKLAFAQKSFEQASLSDTKDKKLFFFVLENEKDDVVGFSGVKTQIGNENWAFSKTLRLNKESESLEWIELESNLSELCSLYLDPKERHHHFGKALSYCRFFFIQTYPHFFQPTLLAQLRGWILPNNECPFWNEIKKFSGDARSKELDFKTAHHLVATSQVTLHELLPGKLPSFNQFSKALRPYIGHVHEDTAGAERLLQEIHFIKKERFDALDAGPHYEKNLLQCPLMSHIRMWNLVPAKTNEKTETLALVDISKSKNPLDFELELVCAGIDFKNNSLILPSAFFEKKSLSQSRALLL